MYLFFFSLPFLMSLKKEALRSAIPLFRLRISTTLPFSSLHLTLSSFSFSFLTSLCFYLFPSYYFFYLLPFPPFFLLPTGDFFDFDVLWS